MDHEPIGDPRPPQFTLLSLFVVVTVTALLLGLLVTAVRAARESARSSLCMNNLRQIGLGLLSYHQSFRCFPPPYSSLDEKRLQSWRLHLVPFLEQGDVEGKDPTWRAFRNLRWDDAWDGPKATAIRAWRFPFYYCPSDGLGSRSNWTSYVAVTGPRTVWPEHGGRRLEECGRSGSDTILAIESWESGIEWTEPRDLEFDHMAFEINSGKPPCISSPHADGAKAIFADRSGRSLSADTSPEVLKALLCIDVPDPPTSDSAADGPLPVGSGRPQSRPPHDPPDG